MVLDNQLQFSRHNITLTQPLMFIYMQTCFLLLFAVWFRSYTVLTRKLQPRSQAMSWERGSHSLLQCCHYCKWDHKYALITATITCLACAARFSAFCHSSSTWRLCTSRVPSCVSILPPAFVARVCIGL